MPTTPTYAHFAIVGALVVIMTMVIADFIHEVVGAKGATLWQRLIAAGKGSITITWARFCAVVACLSGSLGDIADYFNAPGVGDNIRALLQPQTVAIVSLIAALITEIARRRTLNVPPLPQLPPLPPVS